MRLADKIDSVIAVGKANGKIMLDGYTCAVLLDCKASADVVEAIHIALKMGCSGNEILEKDSAIRLAIEAIMEQSK
jgi:predicted ATP-grasp superfamily ATP-dependent carboligase